MCENNINGLEISEPRRHEITLTFDIPDRVVWASRDRQQVFIAREPDADVPPVEKYALDAFTFEWDTENML